MHILSAFMPSSGRKRSAARGGGAHARQGKLSQKKKKQGRSLESGQSSSFRGGRSPGGPGGALAAGSVWIEGDSWDLGRGWSWELLPLGFRGIQVGALSPLPIPSSRPKSRPWGASGALKSSRFGFLGRFAAPLRAGSLGFASGIPDFGTNSLNPEPSALRVGNPWIHPQRYSQ